MVTSQTIIGFDIGGTTLKAGVVYQGNIIKELSAPTPLGSAEALFARVSAVINELVALYPQIDAVGLGVPGTISPQGVVGHSPNLPIDGFDARGFLQANHALTVVVDNDAAMATLGEYRYGVAQEVADFMLLTLGTGVGGGLFLDGSLRKGRYGGAGEIGHMIVDPRGAICACGQRGCLEALASGSALIREGNLLVQQKPDSLLAKEAVLQGGASGALLFSLAEQGDADSVAILTAVGAALGSAITSLSHVLELDLVVLGGAVSGAGRWFLPAIRSVLAGSPFERTRHLRVEISQLKNQAALLGAAAAVLL